VESTIPASILSNSQKTEGLRSRSTSNQWERVQSIVMDNQKLSSQSSSQPRLINTGEWRLPFCCSWGRTVVHHGQSIGQHIAEANAKALKRAASKSGQLVNSVVQDATYAVITFTSRQSAIAARQCLTDGSGLDMWREVEDIPIPPLADAAPFNGWSGRGLCRPVTLTLSDNQKMIRRNM
jgi:hypothetical protein